MSDAPLTSSYCTNWQAYNTPRLWAMVAGEDNPDAWRQVAAWGSLAGTVNDARNRLVRARESLAAAWPPETNASADAFINEFDTLIKSMEYAKQDADSTASGLANILEALRQAKNEIEPLYAQYREKSDDLVPDWWDKAEDEIDEKARQHMITAESVVQRYVPELKVPTPYETKPVVLVNPGKEIGTTSGGGTGGSGGSGGSGLGAGAGAGGSAFPLPHDPVPPLPGQAPTIPDGTATVPPPGGIDLAGGATPVAPPAVPPVGGAPGGVPPVIGGGPVPGSAPLLPPMPGVIGGGGGTGGARPPLGGTPGTIGGGAVPPGGLASGRPTTRATPGAGRGVLPSGAVIGESVAGRTGGGAAGRAGAPGMSSAAGRAGAGSARPGSTGLPGASGRGGSARPGATGVPGGASGRAGLPGGASGRAGLPGGAGGPGSSSGRTAGPGGPGSVSGRPGARGVRSGTKPTPPSWLPEDRPAGGGRSGGGAGAHGPAATMGAAGRRSARAEQEQNPPFDPDNPWGVASGVDPVIEPSRREARHDPGPNVIGYQG